MIMRTRRWWVPSTGRYRGHMGIARRNTAMDPVPRPPELDAYSGLWVAVKDGSVVAAAGSSRELVYEVHKLGSRGNGAVAQFVPAPSTSFMVGVG